MADKINLPDIGDSSGNVITPEEESRIGSNLYRYLRQNNLIIDDPMMQEYISSLGYRLVSNSDQPERKFTFFIVKDPSVNAFAAPGGYIGIHSGLIQLSKNESELAAVIAHEIAHVTQKHMSRTYEAARKHSIATAVAILAAALIGQKSGELAQAALSTGVAASAQMQLNFSRAHEKEADFLGMRTLVAADFNPLGMATMFERMEKSARLYGPELPEFLSTHPVTTYRIAESKNRALGMLKHLKIQENLNYDLVKAHLKVMEYSTPVDAVKAFEAVRRTKPDSNYASYGLAIASMMAGQLDQAETLARNLVKKDPERIGFRLLEAQIQQEKKQYQKAIAILESQLKIFPLNTPLTYQYAETLLKNNQPDEARSTLEEYLQKRTGSPPLYKLLAQAANESGRTGEAYLYQAEFQFMSGNTRLAIQLLSNASKLRNLDFYLASKIEARLAELKQIALQEK